MAEDPPPNDMEGTSDSPENPDAVGVAKPDKVVVVSKKPKGYPIEEVARPITLPGGMSEVGIEARSTFSPFVSNGALRARYGITRQWQIGLRYNAGGFYKGANQSSAAFHPGKSTSVDVTYLFTDWVGASVGVPFYFDPTAASLAIGAPMRFRIGDKLLLGGLNDLLQIRLKGFVPSLTSEASNEASASAVRTNTTTAKGALILGGYGVYQHKANMAFIGRLAITANDFSSLDLRYLLRAGLQYSPKRYLDLSASLGFDDMALPGRTFGVELGLAVRI